MRHQFSPKSGFFMMQTLVLCILLLLFGSEACLAQQANILLRTDDYEPASTNIPKEKPSQINTLRQARFRLYTKNAQSIRVSLRKTVLTKGDDRFRACDTSLLDQGFHYYTINIVDMEAANPASKTFSSQQPCRGALKYRQNIWTSINPKISLMAMTPT